MKVVIVLCVFAFIVLSAGKSQSRGCNFVNGRCYRICEEGTHSYTSDCGPVIPEPTCDEPNPVAGNSYICDHSDCYCDAPTVREPVSGKCVKLEECPKKEE